MDLNCWQSLLPESTPLSMINIPGTHDSCTQFINLSPFSRCQNKSIGHQLETGTRFLDIRLELRDSRFYAVHGIADCRTAKKHKSPFLCFDEVFRVLKAFIEKQPTETVVILVNVGRGNNGDDFYPAFYEQYIEQHLSSWFLENRIPALGECRGKLVLARRCDLGNSEKTFTDENTGLNFSKWPGQGSKDSCIPLTCPFELLNGEPAKESAVVQDRYMFNPKAKWKKVIKAVLENTGPNENTVLLNYFSTAGAPFLPFLNARYINAKFKSYELISKRIYGWIVLDFQSAALNEKIINSNF